MRTSIATVSLSGTLAEKLDAAAAAGFDGVEIFENDLVASPLSPEEVRDRAAAAGLTLDLYQPLRDFEGAPPERFAANLRRAEHKLRLMARLGISCVLVCSSVAADTVADDDLAAEQLRTLAGRAAAYGMTVAYEALAWGRHVDDYRHAWRIVAAADHPALGVCLDSFHILSRGADPAAIADIPGEKIFFVQLADAPRLPMGVLHWSRHHRCFPGQGDFDVAGLLGYVRRAGYAGPLSLEIFNDEFRQADARRTAVDGRRSLLVLEEAADGAPLPPVAPPEGYAFAELSTPDTAAPARLLTALGFTRTGVHPGKPVELWEAGRARILLNTGAVDGVATPGDSTPPGLPAGGAPDVAALGLEIAEPDAAVERARALLSPVLPRRRAARDVPLRAVAAPDGTALFFCRTRAPGAPSWTDDFTGVLDDADAPEPPAPAGITAIDHVALAQPSHRFDTAVLFHRGVLGLRPAEPYDVPDPYGLLRSRAMATPDGALRLVLNESHVGGPAQPNRQHVALASDDIELTARRLRAAGLALPIPDNYYDDLEARYDLGPDRHRRLRELGLLYDRDGDGEFLHLYTVPAGHVLIEVVQRLGGYRGYGMGNASVRLAAQRNVG